MAACRLHKEIALFLGLNKVYVSGLDVAGTDMKVIHNRSDGWRWGRIQSVHRVLHSGFFSVHLSYFMSTVSVNDEDCSV